MLKSIYVQFGDDPKLRIETDEKQIRFSKSTSHILHSAITEAEHNILNSDIAILSDKLLNYHIKRYTAIDKTKLDIEKRKTELKKKCDNEARKQLLKIKVNEISHTHLNRLINEIFSSINKILVKEKIYVN